MFLGLTRVIPSTIEPPPPSYIEYKPGIVVSSGMSIACTSTGAFGFGTNCLIDARADEVGPAPPRPPVASRAPRPQALRAPAPEPVCLPFLRRRGAALPGMVFALYEMKVVLAEVLRGCHVTPLAAPGHPGAYLATWRVVALAPSAGLPVVVDAVAADGAASPRRRVPNRVGSRRRWRAARRPPSPPLKSAYETTRRWLFEIVRFRADLELPWSFVEAFRPVAAMRGLVACRTPMRCWCPCQPGSDPSPWRAAATTVHAARRDTRQPALAWYAEESWKDIVPPEA